MDTLPSVKEVIEKYGLQALKKFGQNFLLDPSITDKIALSAGSLTGKTVIEVGPGPGALTRSILKHKPKTLIVIEKDKRFLPALEDIKSFHPNLLIVEGDALKENLEEYAEPPFKVIANLPYNVATPLLTGWLEKLDLFESFTLMFQKEVAKRISAKPKTSAYGRLSVVCQWLLDVKEIMTLPPGAFHPPPKVDSTVVHLTPKQNIENYFLLPYLEKVTQAAFGQRRKKIRSSLKTLNVCSDALLEQTKLSPDLRAEELDVDEFYELAYTYYTMQEEAS